MRRDDSSLLLLLANRGSAAAICAISCSCRRCCSALCCSRCSANSSICRCWSATIAVFCSNAAPSRSSRSPSRNVSVAFSRPIFASPSCAASHSVCDGPGGASPFRSRSAASIAFSCSPRWYSAIALYFAESAFALALASSSCSSRCTIFGPSRSAKTSFRSSFSRRIDAWAVVMNASCFSKESMRVFCSASRSTRRRCIASTFSFAIASRSRSASVCFVTKIARAAAASWLRAMTRSSGGCCTVTPGCGGATTNALSTAADGGAAICCCCCRGTNCA